VETRPPFRPIAREEPDAPTPPESNPDASTKLTEALQSYGPNRLESLVETLRSAGVAADRWTSPDLLGQLGQAGKHAVDTVLCNILDFDDALPLQETIARAFAAELAGAVALLMAATGAKRGIICFGAQIDDASPRAIEHAARGTRVRIERLVNDYPQPNPILVLHALLGRVLRPGSLPTEAGVLLLDAAAAVAVGRALLWNEPSHDVLVGVADLRGAHNIHPDATQSHHAPHFVAAPIGTSLREILRAADIVPGPFELRGGSPLREVKLSPDSTISGAGEVALYLVEPHPQPNPDPCIRCGWCVSGCPVHINPAGILQAAQAADPVAADRCGVESCIECGICAYVCPSYLPLLSGIRAIRQMPKD
jgi:electron transport complex protein RnfC